MSDKGIIFSAPMVRALLDGRKTQTRRLLSLRGYRGLSEFGPSDTSGYDWHFRRADGCWCDVRDARLRELLPYAPGDRLYVRENFSVFSDDYGWDYYVERQCHEPDRTIVYAADRASGPMVNDRDWQPPRNAKRTVCGPLDGDETYTEIGIIPCIYLPRWASRLTLLVTDVRVQRLQEMSAGDAEAEGLIYQNVITGAHGATGVHIEETADRWWNGTEPDDFEGHDDPVDAFEALWNSLHDKVCERWDDNPWIVTVSFDVKHGNIDRISG